MTVRKGRKAWITKPHVLKNKSKDDECWFDEQLKEIERQGDAREIIEEYFDNLYPDDDTKQSG